MPESIISLEPPELISKVDATRLRKELAAAKRELRDTVEAHSADTIIADFCRRTAGASITPPSWLTPKRDIKRHQVMPVAMCSDWHLDEEVRPEEIQFLNGYNRKIAEQRLERFFQKIVVILRDYLKPFRYPGLTFAMAGDIFSGIIHEELQRTNESSIFQSLEHWVGPFAAGIKMLRKEFGKLYIPVVVGNHGRLSKKPVAKLRVVENLDWFFAKMLAMYLRDEPGLTWAIADGHKHEFSLYNTRFVMSHGDEARGGSGVAGMLSPQLIQYSRMKKRFEFDYWLLGHWHYRSAYRGIRVNGAGKGYDEYASISNFDFQEPCQDLFLVSADHGIICDWPIFVAGENEPWRRRKAASGSVFA